MANDLSLTTTSPAQLARLDSIRLLIAEYEEAEGDGDPQLHDELFPVRSAQWNHLLDTVTDLVKTLRTLQGLDAITEETLVILEDRIKRLLERCDNVCRLIGLDIGSNGLIYWIGQPDDRIHLRSKTEESAEND